MQTTQQDFCVTTTYPVLASLLPGDSSDPNTRYPTVELDLIPVPWPNSQCLVLSCTILSPSGCQLQPALQAGASVTLPTLSTDCEHWDSPVPVFPQLTKYRGGTSEDLICLRPFNLSSPRYSPRSSQLYPLQVSLTGARSLERLLCKFPIYSELSKFS